MTPFSYVSILLAIVVSIAIAHLRNGIARRIWDGVTNFSFPLVQWTAFRFDDVRLVAPMNRARATVGLCASLLLLAAEATGQEHWAFLPVTRPAAPPPEIHGSNAIDAFVAERLAAAGLTRSAEADRATLIRRLHLVMLGVPPTPEDVAAFVADAATDAFERLVDRVLADPRYGERWARHWLDVVRFAESNGFETNRLREHAFRYRDYVIAAWNDDVPYDRFVQEQLVGDALGREAATGFLVAGPRDLVVSPDPALTAQQRADELDDMVGTTGTALLGLTVGCARCHSHKFDPIAQSEYYALAAVFAGVRHGDREVPPSADDAARLAALDLRVAALDAELAPFVVAPPESRPDDERTRPPVDFLRNEERFAPIEARFVRFTVFATTGAEPCIDELEVWSGDENVALARNGARATASSALPGYDIHKVEHVNDGEFGNSRSWISDEAGGGWVELDLLAPRRIDRITWGRDRRGSIRDRLAVRYRIEAGLDQDRLVEVASSADRAPLVGAAAITLAAPLVRAAGPAAESVRARLEARRTALEERARLIGAWRAYAGQFTSPDAIHLLHRGDPMQKGAAIAPGTLALFRPASLAADAPEQARRRMLADWITDPRHPLTARVFVNRVWQHHFGTGIVATPNDFGRNGAAPSHPELLDWLAHEFVAGGYRIKALHRAILTSATWRQTSAPRSEALRVDGATRLLWRYPPRRLEAEAIRDGMLAVSGTLDPRAGGPGFLLHDVDPENVYHYRPKERFGPDEARRMVYATKVRMEQDAVFGAFDCPDGSFAVARRGASTTPLQSLNLFNSAFTLQQAEALAARARREAGGEVPAQVGRVWQLVLQRAPHRDESDDAARLVAHAGLVALCRAMLNSNEFLFVR